MFTNLWAGLLKLSSYIFNRFKRYDILYYRNKDFFLKHCENTNWRCQRRTQQQHSTVRWNFQLYRKCADKNRTPNNFFRQIDNTISQSFLPWKNWKMNKNIYIKNLNLVSRFTTSSVCYSSCQNAGATNSYFKNTIIFFKNLLFCSPASIF